MNKHQCNGCHARHAPCEGTNTYKSGFYTPKFAKISLESLQYIDLSSNVDHTPINSLAFVPNNNSNPDEDHTLIDTNAKKFQPELDEYNRRAMHGEACPARGGGCGRASGRSYSGRASRGAFPLQTREAT